MPIFYLFISFCLVACEPFRAQFRCHCSTSKTDFFGTFQLTPFAIALNGSPVYPLLGELGLKGPKTVDKILGLNFGGGYKFSRICARTPF